MVDPSLIGFGVGSIFDGKFDVYGSTAGAIATEVILVSIPCCGSNVGFFA